MKFRVISSIAIAAVSTIMLGSCGADPDSAGFEYMPDMYRSSAIEPYVDYGEIKGRENAELKMKLSAKVPPFGTIPYYGTDSNGCILYDFEPVPLALSQESLLEFDEAKVSE